LWTTDPKAGMLEWPTGYLNVLDWERQAQSFSGMAYMRTESLIWTGEPEPEPVATDFVSPNWFAELGVGPAAGRTFTADEAARGEARGVISYELWQRRLGGSRNAIGRHVPIGGKLVEIIGVLPAGFRPLHKDTALWMPYTSATFFREEADS